MFSICVPSWNSLEYLKILVAGLKKNTRVPYELIVHDNGSTDGTQEWLAENKISCTRSEKNLGFCGVNNAIASSFYPFTIIMNTDMYPLPGWDLALFDQINKFQDQGIRKFTISCCLIEPSGNNPEYTIFNAGYDAGTFSEPILVGNYVKNRQKWKKENTTQYSHPILFTKDMLSEVNFLDEQYFPGWAVDHDIAASVYKAGCRNFVMLGDSRVYHFSSKTFKKLPDDVRRKDGQDIFFKKWGITVDEFRHKLGVAKPFAVVDEYVLSKT